MLSGSGNYSVGCTDRLTLRHWDQVWLPQIDSIQITQALMEAKWVQALET